MVGESEHEPEEKGAGGRGEPDASLVAVEKAATGDDVEGARPRFRRRGLLLLAGCAAALAVVIYVGFNSKYSRRLTEQLEKVTSAIGGERARPRSPYAEALARIEEDRGEAIGREVKIEVPQELKLYRETRRFLAVQEAAAREADIKSPHDFAELVEMLRGGEPLVEVPKLGRDYVLYGVGLAASGELTHYERGRGGSVPLFASEEELKAYTDALAEDGVRLESELKGLEEGLKAIDKRDKEGRARVAADVKAKRKELAGVRARSSLVEFSYRTPQTRQALFAERELLEGFARDFGGRAYDLRDETAVKECQARLLSYLRPEALSVIEELGASYREKFGRPLPITSLIRTEEYQKRLREGGNANAADVSVPPHTTGLAFDVFYHYMTAAEQGFVMSEIARLEAEGRVEGLRELRDHYHVFVFPEGRRPPEKLIKQSLRDSGKGK